MQLEIVENCNSLEIYEIKMWTLFTSAQSLCPARLLPSCRQKPWESRRNLPLDVRRPAADHLIRNSNVKYWKRFVGEILSLETGGMGAGGRSGSRQRGGWNPGPLPSSHGQERLFQRFLGNQVYSPNAAGWPPKMIQGVFLNWSSGPTLKITSFSGK